VTDISLRPEQDADAAFLLQLYGTLRQDELAMTGWDAGTAERFVRMQFEAQWTQYRAHNAQARFDLVLARGVPIGRLYVAPQPQRLHVIDLALMPAWRGRGIGGALLGAVQREAAAHGKRVSIYVETSNPALTLYQRLGFQEVSVSGVHRLMEWVPPAHAA
jgi:ribosomal protein S18 acetylase RimI-like enzyme